jgi:hypothetical protein
MRVKAGATHYSNGTA